jgi:hypothetical protein
LVVAFVFVGIGERLMERLWKPFRAAQDRLVRNRSERKNEVTDQRGRLLKAAVGFAGCSVPSYDRALWALRTWLDSWAGIGTPPWTCTVKGYDLQLTRYDEKGWRATFYTTGMEHSPTSATGTAWERTPWHATLRAAWEC